VRSRRILTPLSWLRLLLAPLKSFYTRGLIVDPAELFEKRENAPRISLRDVIRMTSGKAFSLFQPSCLAEKLLFSIK
jgi:hypothetical protein